MAILTSFLKLLKPEKNDYVDVDKHIGENYDKIDAKVQELDNSEKKNSQTIEKLTQDIAGKANTSHTHKSSDVLKMEGYSKSYSGGAIIESDSLNNAIGKIEKNLDSKSDTSHKHSTLIIRNGSRTIEYDGGERKEIVIQTDGGVPGSHEHSTNEITSLTGYNKGSLTGQLTTSDTLNTALEKIENNLDNKQPAGNYAQYSHTHTEYARTNHIQPSSTISEMSGYSKSYYGGSINQSDSLNTAIGKLEKNLDNKSDYGHTHSQYANSSEVATYLNNKANKSHTHDDRYYTETEVDNELAKKLNKGTVSSDYDTAKKIEDKIKTKLNQGNVPDVLNSAEKIIKALQGNTGIKFDENLLYLNDSGTKKKGYCYIDKLTDGIFECIQETTTTVNNATYFKNFSNKENSDRLSNLIKKKKISIPYSNFGIALKDAINGKSLVEAIKVKVDVQGEIISIVADESSGAYIENFQKNYEGINCSAFVDNGLLNTSFSMSATIFYI